LRRRAAVNGVCVAEVVRALDPAVRERRAGERREFAAQLVEQLCRPPRVEGFVVVPLVVASSELAPVVARDLFDRLARRGENRARRVLGEDRERVAGRDEEVSTEDEIAVAIAVAGRAEVGRAFAVETRDEFGSMDEVRVGVMPAEVGQRLAVDDGSGWRAESL